MKVSQEFIQMAKASVEIQSKRTELQPGDFYSPDGKTIKLFKGRKVKRFIWIPRIDQLFEIVPDLLDQQEGSRRLFEAMSQSYYIPNPRHTYNTIEEHIFSYIMYRCYGKIWLPKLDKKGRHTGYYHWYSERQAKVDKLETLIGKLEDQEVEYRTVPVYKNGTIVAMKTERYTFDFDSGKVVVLPEEVKEVKK